MRPFPLHPYPQLMVVARGSGHLTLAIAFVPIYMEAVHASMTIRFKPSGMPIPTKSLTSVESRTTRQHIQKETV